MPAIRLESLPFSVIARELVGTDHGADACLIFVDAPPGKVVALHRHPYQEILVIQAGRGTFTVGDEQLEAGAGEIVIVPAGVAHGFANTGDEPLRQLDIHLSPSFSTEWLERG